jgi:hypothetical protein
MARKAPHEHVERFRQRRAEQESLDLREALEAWANTAELEERYPSLPDELDDRAADCWEPLFTIAEEAGGDWRERARDAALYLSADRRQADESRGIRLLGDCRRIFSDSGRSRLSTEELLRGLNALEEAPWGDFYGKPLAARRLSTLLKPYGIKSAVIRIGEKTPHGYDEAAFRDAWSRYLPPETQHPQQVPICSENVPAQNATETPNVADGKAPICRDVAYVADKGPQGEDQAGFEVEL